VIAGLLVLLTVWVFLGLAMLFWYGRRRGTDAARALGSRVVARGEPLTVTLSLRPPMVLDKAEDHDLVVLLDHSGSMGALPGSPLREMTRAAENFVRSLPSTIDVALIAFDHEAKVLCPFGQPRTKALDALKSIVPGGGTDIAQALDRAAEVLNSGRPATAKTVALFSDGLDQREPCREAASRLRASPAMPDLVCAGFGSSFNTELACAITGGDDKVVKIDAIDDIETLFAFLLHRICPHRASSASVREPAAIPRPFSIAEIGKLHPAGVELQPVPEVVWAIPNVSERSAETIEYGLRAECIGWHVIGSGLGSVRWRMPDGTFVQHPLPPPPRVLVLPPWLLWAWPVVNPLAMLLLRPLLKCAPVAVDEPQSVPRVVALEAIELPTPLPAAGEDLFRPTPRPMLAIGIGATGGATLRRFAAMLGDRGIAPDAVSLVALDLGACPRVESLDGIEWVTLAADFRRYLESLHGAARQSRRSWIPLRDWLAQSSPLTTARGAEGDRRKARLALLLDPTAAEERIGAALERLRAQGEPLVVLVGGAAEAEASGLLAEVAHMCAGRGSSVTALLDAACEDPDLRPSVTALSCELERFCALSGDLVVSDRGGVELSAARLFDRIIVVAAAEVRDGTSPDALAGTLWGLANWPELIRRMPPLQGSQTYRLSIDFMRLPQQSLWEWTSERVVQELLCARWLADDTDQDDRQRAAQAAAARLWQRVGGDLGAPLFLRKAAGLIAGGNPLVSLLEGFQDLPQEASYDRQKPLAERERLGFARCLAQWCQDELRAARHLQRWGLPVLRDALATLESQLGKVRTDTAALAANAEFVNYLNLAINSYQEFAAQFADLRRETETWMAAFFSDPERSDESQVRLGLCGEGAARLLAARAGLAFAGADAQAILESAYMPWRDRYGAQIFEQLAFDVRMAPDQHRVRLCLHCFEQTLADPDEAPAAVRDALTRYRDAVLVWPDRRWLPAPLPLVGQVLGAGRHVAELDQPVSEVIDDRDPVYTARLTVERLPLGVALAAGSPAEAEAAYVWPEEATAARIAQQLANRLELQPRPFTPQIVGLLGDCPALYGFLAAVADGSLQRRGNELVLDAGGRLLRVGEVTEPLASFAAAARQVAVQRLSLDGETLPDRPRPNLDGRTLLAGIEASRCCGDLTLSPDWPMWQHLVLGVALDQSGQVPISTT